MKDRAKELKAARRGPRAAEADGEGDVLAKIAEMPEADRVMAERLRGLIKASAPANCLATEITPHAAAHQSHQRS